MALTNAFIAILAAQLLVYFTLFKNPIRWVRMMGSVALIAVGVSIIVIETSTAMYIFFLVSLMIGGIQLLKDTASLVKNG